MANEAEVFSRPNAEDAEAPVVIENALSSPLLKNTSEYSFPASYVLRHSSGKVYIGSTKNLNRRIKDHRVRLAGGIHPNKNVQNAFNEDAGFDLLYLHCESKEEALAAEQLLLDKFNEIGFAPLLNVATDARISLNGLKMSDETKAKMSASHKQQSNTDVARAKNSDRMKALWANKEKKKMYLSCVGLKPKPIVINDVTYASAKEAAAFFNCHEATARRYAREQLQTSKDKS